MVQGRCVGQCKSSLNFLIVPGEHPILYVLLGSFSLLGFYWIYLNATGLKNGGERVTSTAAWTATLVLWFVGILLFAGYIGLFPNFIS